MLVGRLLFARTPFESASPLAFDEACKALESFNDLVALRHGWAPLDVTISPEAYAMPRIARVSISLRRADLGFRGKLRASASGTTLEGWIGSGAVNCWIFIGMPIWLPLLQALNDSPVSIERIVAAIEQDFLRYLGIGVALWVLLVHGAVAVRRRRIAGALHELLNRSAAW